MRRERRMYKKRALLCLLLCLSVALCSCAGGSIPVIEETASPVTLPPITDTFEPPVGDAQLSYSGDATMYLIHKDAARLVSVTRQVEFSAAKRRAESLARALLACEGDGVAQPLGGSVKLQLYGANPVEISRDVATVNLSASALQLDSKDYYMVCQAIANTLTEISDIHYVNVQVVDKQMGLDIASSLATGCFQRSVGTDVGARYEQIVTQRVMAGQSEEEKRLSAVVTLYFPLTGGDGVMCESRSVTFENQRASDMVSELIRQLSLGSGEIYGAPPLKGLDGMLNGAPIVGDMRDTGGRVVTLRFNEELDDWLNENGISRASLIASLCYTVTSFLPNVSGVVTFIGEELVDGVKLNKALGNAFPAEAMLFEAGLCQRRQFSGFLMDDCTLYFADPSGEDRLIRTKRPVPYHQAASPRYLLLQLMRGPVSFDTTAGAPLFTGSRLIDADIMGLALSGSTLLVNLSDRFQGLGADMTPEKERLLAYALTNTLLENGAAVKARYYQSGKEPLSLTGEISWAGDFIPIKGLVKP